METYIYDSQNRLIGWTDGVSVISCAYDALDRRIAVTVDAMPQRQHPKDRGPRPHVLARCCRY
ncbi:hypothetical protein [Rhodophyticola porphyridii]|uniref:RHS repeat protein n=1 Tax=Rhodophyticola porphyridii TaxID=1852017 RepID=A0A3L9XVH7_9RHOB|nr:hypothetical protein [Rhodophyticola porphyridii]RMA40611.1 hypothetical protein D9R08_18740 [Rhodophyticola porphyridii]